MSEIWFTSVYIKNTFANNLKEKNGSFFHTVWHFCFLHRPHCHHPPVIINSTYLIKQNQANISHQLPHKLAHKVSVFLMSFFLRISWVFSPFSGPFPAYHQHKRINMQYDKCSSSVCVFHLLTSVSLSACAAAEIVSVLHFLPTFTPVWCTLLQST